MSKMEIIINKEKLRWNVVEFLLRKILRILDNIRRVSMICVKAVAHIETLNY